MVDQPGHMHLGNGLFVAAEDLGQQADHAGKLLAGRLAPGASCAHGPAEARTSCLRGRDPGKARPTQDRSVDLGIAGFDKTGRSA